jgi:predicted transcriptional regulator
MSRQRRSLDDQLAKQSAPAEVLPVAAAKVADKEQKRNSQPGSRASKKAISGFFEMEVSRQLKIIAATEDKTIQGLLGEALNLLFEKYGKDAIAQSDE